MSYPQIYDRRRFIQNALRMAPGALLAGPLASAAFRAMADSMPLANRVIPNFADSNILRFTAGLRPYRKTGLRIEREERFGKTVVHNYGHSGGGITLAWGSAEAAVELIQGLSKLKPIAVLGGGVIGLTTAHELRARGYPVTIYAEKFHPNVTSSVAGGQWSPTLVGTSPDPAEQARYQRILETSFKKYAAFAGPKYGVYMRDNIIADGSDDQLQKLTIPSLPAHTRLDKLPFEGVNVGGYLYHSWLIEPPVLLPALTARLRHMKTKFVTKTFRMDDNAGNASSDVSGLTETVVFNCLGLGAKKLIVDEALEPIRGRLVHLHPNLKVNYLLLTSGYLFSRSDAIILGGTYDKGVSDVAFDSRPYEGILKTHRDFFGLPDDSSPPPPGIPYIAIGE